jgi:hypothetical protein
MSSAQLSQVRLLSADGTGRCGKFGLSVAPALLKIASAFRQPTIPGAGGFTAPGIATPGGLGG